MAYIWVFVGIAAGFFAMQAILSKRAKNSMIKSIPAALLIVGLLFCLTVYFGFFGISSASVIAENQAFAKFLAVHLAVGLAGCVGGAAFACLRKAAEVND